MSQEGEGLRGIGQVGKNTVLSGNGSDSYGWSLRFHDGDGSRGMYKQGPDMRD